MFQRLNKDRLRHVDGSAGGLLAGSGSGSDKKAGLAWRLERKKGPARFGPWISSGDLGWQAKAVWAGGVAAAHLLLSFSSLL